METHPLGEEASVETSLLFKACHMGWVNKSGITREGCKSLGYRLGVMNGGNLCFFQVYVYAEKQLCKDDRSPPVLLVSRWRSEALPWGKLPPAVLG